MSSIAILRKNILSFLDTNNLSQRNLSEKIGMSPTALNSFINSDKPDLRVSTLCLIAKAMGVSPSYLIATNKERLALLNKDISDDLISDPLLVELAKRLTLRGKC